MQEDFKNTHNAKEKHQNDENTNVDQSMISRHLQKGKPNEWLVRIVLLILITRWKSTT